MKAVSHLVQAHLQKLEPYTPGVQPSGTGWIKLNTNELPFSPPEAVKTAIINELNGLARYPNPRSETLRLELAGFYGLNANQVIVGNGSDDILNLVARAFGGIGRITVETFPSYSLYPVITTIAGGSILSVPFSDDFELPLAELVQAKPQLIFLTCPNAPTGVRFPMRDLEALANSFEGLLVIDEAYAEFSEGSAVPLLYQNENVFLTRTFSKAYGLAGMRVGYGLGSPFVVSVLDRIRDSYNVSRLSQVAAIAAIRSYPLYQEFITEIKSTREAVREELQAIGWKVFPSEANFLFGAPVDSNGNSGPHVAISLFNRLEERKILVRYFPKHPLTASFLRISIGTKAEMDRFLEEVRIWNTNA